MKYWNITLGTNRNGLKVLRFKTQGQRGFSVQTNGNLPHAHRMPYEEAKDNQLVLLWALKDYVYKYGTTRQRNALPLRGEEFNPERKSK